MQLTTVQGSMALEAATARAWFAFEAAARARYGFDPLISSPGGAWRSPEMVLDMWQYPGKYGATKGVAKPRSLGGPGSVHENGRCVDINNWAVLGSKNLEPLAKQFGFTRTIAKEPWHFQHDGVTATGGGASGAGGATPITHEEDEPMLVKYIDQSDGRRNVIVWDNVTKQYDQIVGTPEAVQATANLWAGVAVQANTASTGQVPTFQWIVANYRKGTFPFNTPTSGTVTLPEDLARKSDIAAVPGLVVEELKKPGN